MPLKLIRNDITKMPVDVIVNAANTALKMGGGVCGAIFSAAGAEKLQAECDRIGKCKVGEAVLTKGYNLPARYVIHAVGPIWRGGSANEADLLKSCYLQALALAWKHGCQSIAFPLISSGIYGYPKDQALRIAISAIAEFLRNREMTVYLVAYDKNAFVLNEKLFSALEKYLDKNYIEERRFPEDRRLNKPYHLEELQNIREEHLRYGAAAGPEQKKKRSLADLLGRLDESFAQMLLRLIDEKGLTDVETYKKANLDRKLFSKIRSGKGYNPSKATALALAIALELNLDETDDLLSKAGYTLSHSNKFDVIIEYFIEEGNYNIHEINEALFAFNQAILGG